ncbi:hypothetical protein HKX48_009541 [Thoreauomyces humboldtii]|nr:hypothetical protein HKX48_009541 [Thoreauomyces humboldtii]
MSAAPSRTQGNVDQAVGTAKSTLGSLVGNRSLEAEGKAQNAHGVYEDEAKKGSNRVEALGEGLAGKVKTVVGAVTGDQEKQARGNAEINKANLKSQLNQ